MANYTPYPLPCKIPLKIGTNNVVTMKATLIREAINFTVQFRCPNDSIALQMVADFDKTDPEVKCNSYFDGKWGQVETYPMCFRKGEEFKLEITFRANLFTIVVNGCSPGFNYHYRDPAQFNLLEVNGDLDSPVHIKVDQ